MTTWRQVRYIAPTCLAVLPPVKPLKKHSAICTRPCKCTSRACLKIKYQSAKKSVSYRLEKRRKMSKSTISNKSLTDWERLKAMDDENIDMMIWKEKMNTKEMIEKIAEKDFDVNEFVQLAIDDENVRTEIVHQMLTNPEIMVYYHCYYVVEKASRKRPEVFYPYWAEIAKLLHHKNSYHRDFAIEIVGNLTKVDQENRFAGIEEDYFGILNDEKFMTGNCCVRNLLKIFRHRVGQRERIIETLLDIDNRCNYTEKQKGILKADVLEIFDEVYQEVPKHDEINEFIKAEVNCISPKTRKKAKELIKKYSL